jgi:hypothetical protein
MAFTKTTHHPWTVYKKYTIESIYDVHKKETPIPPARDTLPRGDVHRAHRIDSHLVLF